MSDPDLSIFHRISSSVSHDAIIAITAATAFFFALHYFEGFEYLYQWTREHEDYDLDEFILFFLASPFPILWFAYRKMKEASKEQESRMQVEKLLAHSRKLESLGTLAGGVSHELNNQILPIMTMADLLRNKMGDQHPDYRKIDIIFKGATNAKNTVAKVLEFSRISDDVRNNCDAFAVCRETEGILTASIPSNASLDFDINDTSAIVEIAHDDLMGAVVNLVSNAVDAMEGKQGRIAVKADVAEIDSSNYVKITFTDTGHGMDASTQQRILDPFFTTKVAGKGVGLGLSIVNTTVTQAKGRILIESEKGQGTTITLLIPLSKHNKLR